MDIAAASMAKSNSNVANELGISAVKRSLDSFEQVGDQLTKMMNSIPTVPAMPSGSSFDVSI